MTIVVTAPALTQPAGTPTAPNAMRRAIGLRVTMTIPTNRKTRIHAP